MYNLILPGQGSQRTGMFPSLFGEDADSIKIFEQASSIVGADLLKIADDEILINQTEFTQPLLLTASYAIWEKIKNNCQIASIGGHSLGEFSALVIAESISFQDAVSLVSLRGKLMSKVEGGMAAVLGMEDKLVEEICKEISVNGEYVAGANYNIDGQLVIAGKKSSLALAEEKLKASGARRVITLAVSIPSHCDLMKEASMGLAEALSNIEIKMPQYPFFSNYTANEVKNLEELKENLVNQLIKPLLWKYEVKSMSKYSNNFLELGSSVLSDMMKKIDDSLVATSLNTKEKIGEFIYG